ncbi:cadherin-like domain-containing protein, partial [Planktomarina temperata]|nr:cadherin-like domain-containing protein [Planktomarina temperata]
FNTENADGTRTETGLEGDGTFTRQFEYNFDADGDFTGGTEIENGVTYALDENWNRKVSVDIDNLTAVTDGIDDIPAVLKADTNDDGTVDAVYRTVIRDESSDGGPVEMAYFDDDGNMLGKSFQETYDMGEITEQFTNFETIDASGMHEWAGNVRIRFEADGSTPNFKEVRSAVEFDGSVTPLAYTNENGDAASFTGMYRFEDDKEFSTSDGGVSWDVETSREFYYDIDSGGYWTLLKGTETSSDGSSYEYGYDYAVLGVSVQIPDDAIDIDPTSIDVEPGLGVKLSDIFAFGGDETSAKKSADFTPSENNNRGTENYFANDGKLIGFKEVFDYSIGANTGPRGAEYFDSEGEYIGRVEYFDHDNDDTTSDVVRFVNLNIEVNETTSREIEIFQNNSGIKYVEDVLFTAKIDGTIDVVASAQDIDTNNDDEVVFWEKINSNVTVNDDRDLLTFEGTYIDVLAGIQITLSGVDAVTGEPVATLLTEYTGSGSPAENNESSFFDIMPVNNIGVDPSYLDATGLSADNIRAAVYWEIFGEKLNDDFEYPDVEPTPIFDQAGNLVGVEFAGAKYALQLLGNITPVMSEDGNEIIGFGGTATEVKPLLIEGRPQGENDVTIGGSDGLSINVDALFELMSDDDGDDGDGDNGGGDPTIGKLPFSLNDDDGTITADEYSSWMGISGTAPLEAVKVILELTAAESNQIMTYSTVVKDDGTWSMPLSSSAGALNGSYSINLRAVDENDIVIATETDQITILQPDDAVNAAPKLTGSQTDLQDGLEDTTYTFSIADLLVGFTDIDGDPLTV